VKIRIELLVVMTLMCAGSLAAAQPAPPPPPRMHGPPPIADLAKELNLTAKQKTAIRDLTDDEGKAEAKLRAEIEVAQIDLRRLMESDDADEAKVGAQIDKVSALEGEAHKTHLLTFLKIRKLLSKDQRDKLDELRARRPEPPPPPPEPGEPVDPFAAQPAPPDHHDAKAETKVGTLFIGSEPHAKIFIDGKEVGTTPLKTSVAPGRHKVHGVYDNGHEITESVMVDAGMTARVVWKDE
jgi:Spy/CpxP family protein refolding chaperone